MYCKYTNSKNNNSSYYFTLANKLQNNNHQSKKPFRLTKKEQRNQKCQRPFTFNKQFYTCQNQYSGYDYKPYISKYRSQSLPPNYKVNDRKYPYFDYYDQLKKRQYLQLKNYKSTSNLNQEEKNSDAKGYQKQDSNGNQKRKQNDKDYDRVYQNYQRQRQGSSSQIYSADINRFSKYGQHHTISKGVNTQQSRQILSAKVKVYSRPYHQNAHTKVDTVLRLDKLLNKSDKAVSEKQYQLSNQLISDNNHLSDNLKVGIKRQNQAQFQLGLGCRIQLETDNQGIFYSTVQTDLETIVTGQQIQYDEQKRILTATTTLERDQKKTKFEENILANTQVRDLNSQQNFFLHQKIKNNQTTPQNPRKQNKQKLFGGKLDKSLRKQENKSLRKQQVKNTQQQKDSSSL